MSFEYVALPCFNLDTPETDTYFIARYASLQARGWQEVGRAPWQVRKDASGACIMRRPKDEPQEEPEMVEYEYMILPPEDMAYAGQCRAAVRNKKLADEGWENWTTIPSYAPESVPVCVVRRKLQRKDEPHTTHQDEGHEYIAVAWNEPWREPTGISEQWLEGYTCVGWEVYLQDVLQVASPQRRVSILRREKSRCRPKDEPRMWTEGEIEEIAKNLLGCSGWTRPRPASAWGDTRSK